MWLDRDLCHKIADRSALLATDGSGKLFGLFEDHAQAIAFERYPCSREQGQRIVERPGQKLADSRLDLRRRDTQTEG